MKKVSLIIPIYNAEKYLNQCLNSAIQQTYQNMEFICVNDGSTDSSGQILSAFAKKDSRIKMIHKENQGESHARNVGLLACTGEYIGFLDCDDWIEPNMYRDLVQTMETNKTDLVASSWMKEYENKQEIMKNKEKVRDSIFGRDELLFYVYNRDAYQGFAYMWDKLFQREVLYDENGRFFLFDESLQLGADVIYLAQVCLNTKKGCYIDHAYYHYRQRKDSGSHVIDLKRRLDWLKAYQVVIDLFEKESVDYKILIYVKRFLAYHSSNTAEIAYIQKNQTILKKCIEIMKKYQKEYENTNLDFPDRIKRYHMIRNFHLPE